VDSVIHPLNNQAVDGKKPFHLMQKVSRISNQNGKHLNGKHPKWKAPLAVAERW